ncbi:lanC-like protein 3 homolog isoform X1 [Belonocnema kinseyi]|uniref:lanC-like protein 3 homolog isoform X1 n=2 Tax=Belonocnema kinseyi TaxID=2817044 RepID=UPI00143D8658|nr:lanC-like protein 3 homolog isoform X1 [Belonocnema kinseyi]
MSKQSRCFVNIYQLENQQLGKGLNFEQGIEVGLKSAKETLKQLVGRIVKSSAPDCTDIDGGLYVGSVGIAYAFLHLRECGNFESENQSNEYLKLAHSYLHNSLQNLERKNHRPDSSFLLGDAGVFAVGAVASAASGNADQVSKLSKRYLDFSDRYKKIDFLSCGSDEFFVGRTGYLFGALWLNRRLGKTVVSPEILQELCRLTVQSGKSYAQKNSSPCPLMYSYYDTEYLGAAHGLSAILQVLIQVPGFLDSDPQSEKLVKDSVDYLLGLQTPEGNFPTALDEIASPRKDEDELVHWCHGAPGVIYLMAVAYQRWKDKKYLESCFKAGELVWNKGLLKKGPGICHGVAGNGYVFLLLYRLTSDRLYLFRAAKFAEFLVEAQFLQEARKPDCPYSLYEGFAGTVCFLADLIEPQKAAFPFQDVFY